MDSQKQLAELRKKKPQVPKFEPTQESKTKLMEKMGELMSKLSGSASSQETTTTDQVVPQPAPEASGQTKKAVEPEKKKLSLSNINEKLASMMNQKKDLLKAKPQTKQPKKEQLKSETTVLPSGRKINLDEEYDPNYPNNYDAIKAYYEEAVPELPPTEPEPTEMQVEVEQDQTVGLSETEQKALKMMQKYGYKVGEGLGKNKQGITTPLTIKKTTESSCIIMPSSIPMDYVVPKEVSVRTALQTHRIQPTSVIVLNNILTIDQLNEEHEASIREQLSKYGSVVEMMVYLLGRDLRIFIRFESPEQSLRAFTDLNQKYYEGNLVSVRFYSETSFGSYRLDEQLHEHINC